MTDKLTGCCRTSAIHCRNVCCWVFSSAIIPCAGTSRSNPWHKSPYRRRYSIESGNNLLKSSWPIPSVEQVFLPHFKLFHDVNTFNYKVLRLLSKGAFGAVYEVINTKSNDKWAMKVLKKSKIIESDCVNQVKTEVEIQRAVGHHNFIASSPHTWQTKPLLFIIFELAECGDLHGFVHKYGPLPEELNQIYIAQISLAIEFLHGTGVIHRDIKPENILLDSNFNIKLSDFGLAKWLQQGPMHRTYTICGSHNYAAPEVMKGEGYGHPADWWSLGQVSCFLHTLKVVDYTNIQLDLESTAKDLSVGARDLLARLLNPDPATRLHSHRQLTTIPYYHHFNFQQLSNKEINIKKLIDKFSSSAIEDWLNQHQTPADSKAIDLEKFDFF